jgi:hypothetical protein
MEAFQHGGAFPPGLVEPTTARMTTPPPLLPGFDQPPPESPPPPPIRLRWLGGLRLAWLLAALPSLVMLAAVIAPPFNHDVAGVLEFSERWLDGERLYRDLIDVNPPLIFILTLLPAAIAKWTPLDGPQALLSCALLLCAACWWLCHRLRADRPEGPVEAAVLTALLPLVMLVPGFDFAQREALMTVAALPYLFLAARRAEGRPTRRALMLAASLVAAVGFALKPHFLAIPFLVELTVAVLRWRREGPAAAGRVLRDPVPWLLAATWVVYLAGVALFLPDYLGHVVPLAWDYYLENGSADPLMVMVNQTMGPLVVLLLALVPLALRRGAGTLALMLAAAGLGGMISAWVQHKGWSYHGVPMLVLGPLLAGLLAARFGDRLLGHAQARAAGPVIAAALAAAIAVFATRGTATPWIELEYPDNRVGHLATWLQQHAEGQRVLPLTPDVHPVYPALNYAHARSILPTMNAWLLIGNYLTCPANGATYRDPAAMSEAERFIYTRVPEDFARLRPKVVMVTPYTGTAWCGAPFDFIEYFRRNPLFAESWKQYRPAGELDGYRLFVREE